MHASASRCVEFGDARTMRLVERRGQPARLFRATSLPTPRTSAADPPTQGQPVWTLDGIVHRLLTVPRSQFNVYYADNILPTNQRELVGYRTRSRGRVSRSELSRSHGDVLQTADALRARLQADLKTYGSRGCFFTFLSAPTYGLDQFSEDCDAMHDYQSLDLHSVASIQC